MVIFPLIGLALTRLLVLDVIRQCRLGSTGGFPNSTWSRRSAFTVCAFVYGAVLTHGNNPRNLQRGLECFCLQLRRMISLVRCPGEPGTAPGAARTERSRRRQRGKLP